ncbi:hypothetical protein DWF00_22455 [Bosea caraganae]|uniref:DUF551 domain-containing protein n=2 Tax=Bosea caraganae TaxID=2763117 RepID=A0A370L1P3_9HYPH|nr:hypothetical protein DWE98_20520 [Bosea caraganae]RDJ23391.1 hypothetical protein DWF00_22455 [Bosea caraganae]
MSETVEVTDGDRVERARFRRPASEGAELRNVGWLCEDGRPLDWQPTHWRPILPKPPTFVLD